jgi:hypothetical protein
VGRTEMKWVKEGCRCEGRDSERQRSNQEEPFPFLILARRYATGMGRSTLLLQCYPAPTLPPHAYPCPSTRVARSSSQSHAHRKLTCGQGPGASFLAFQQHRQLPRLPRVKGFTCWKHVSKKMEKGRSKIEFSTYRRGSNAEVCKGSGHQGGHCKSLLPRGLALPGPGKMLLVSSSPPRQEVRKG